MAWEYGQYIPYLVALALFVIGFFIGKQSDEKMLKNMAKALNINRELGEGTDKKQHLFIEKGKVKGSMEVSFSVDTSVPIVDFEKKKAYTKDGTFDLSEKRIAELRLLPQFRKTAV